MPSFYEFFAGGGMARAGLGLDWECLFANDFDPKKADCYEANWGCGHLSRCDIASLTTANLPGHADLAWASFPCQDLSLAGAGAGLKGSRSGTFWSFWKLIEDLNKEHRSPQVIVLENVCGTLSSHEGKDFEAICKALVDEGYYFGAVIIDAALFLPQSRPRLFIVGIKNFVNIPPFVITGGPIGVWHPDALVEAYAKLPKSVQELWIWLDLPMPLIQQQTLIDLLEETPNGVSWHTPEETEKLLAMMTPQNLAKVEAAQQSGHPVVGTVYKRTRKEGPDKKKVQRAEVRFDGIAGCLRTPAGGSSRQTIMVINGNQIRSRLLSPREAARLMGLPDNYLLPNNYNDAYHLAGDGVVVPVVRFLSEHILEQLLPEALIVDREAA
jgi:DNA (cytosine-5)-methyltransferase 1